ncbi:MAG: addiction module protein [Pirellulaceae bacterium]|nr:addiction module protein [Pirellulaceae bacterium]
MSISIHEIRRLPVNEQLSLAEQIWDGLLASGQLLHQWQIDEVRGRVKELNENPDTALTEEEMWRRVDDGRNA